MCIRDSCSTSVFNFNDNWIKNYKGKVVDKLSETNQKYDFIISCVGNDEDLKEITSKDKGCLKSLKEKSIFIDHSTVSPRIVREVEKNLENLLEYSLYMEAFNYI